MSRKLLTFWAVPAAADPDALRELRLLYGVTRPQVLVYAASALLLLVPGVTSPAAARASGGLLLLSAAAQLAGLALAHRGRLTAGARTVVATTLTTAMASVSMIGGLRGTLAATLLLAVLAAGVMRGWRSAAVAAAASGVYALAEHAAERAGLAPLVQASISPGASVISTVAMLAIVALLLALYTREMARAVAARQESDARTLATERALAELVRSAPDGIMVLTPEGVIVSVNEAAERMSGYPASALVGRHVTDLSELAGPEVMARVVDAVSRLGSTPSDLILQLDLRRGDGSLLVIETNGRLVARHGGEAAIHVVVRDVTARVVAERERQRLEEALLEARRMEGIGRLAGGIAHDFRNLLTPILVNAGSIAGGAPDARELAGEIEEAAQRANALTGQLLAFARRQRLETRVLDLGEVVRGLEPILRRVVREDVRFDLRLAPRLPPVRADRSQLEQVVLNLVANACDAMPQGGHLLVATSELAAPRAAVAGGEPGPPAPHVSLLVSDTGRGMTEEIRARVFEPFFTTKEAGRGVGLGLATVHGIVTQSGGSVQVESEPGRGSTFRVLLPAADGAAEPALPGPAPEGAELPPGLRVLVADDAPLVRGTVARVLRDRGVEVVEAQDGLSALAAVRADGGRFDLLVTDVVMPGLPGPALADQLRSVQPDLAVLLISGYADPAAGAPSPDASLLAKPFTPAQLLARVAEALGRRGDVARTS